MAHVTEEGEALGDVGRYGEVIFEDLDELKRGRWVGLGCEDGVGKVLDEEHLGGAEEAVVIGLVVGPELGPKPRIPISVTITLCSSSSFITVRGKPSSLL